MSINVLKILLLLLFIIVSRPATLLLIFNHGDAPNLVLEPSLFCRPNLWNSVPNLIRMIDKFKGHLKHFRVGFYNMVNMYTSLCFVHIFTCFSPAHLCISMTSQHKKEGGDIQILKILYPFIHLLT